jgi:hypothetical protein
LGRRRRRPHHKRRGAFFERRKSAHLLGLTRFNGWRQYQIEINGLTSPAVYLRHTTICKDGKTHTDWRLVRSVRRGRKVVQETVAHLGELDGQGRARARLLALQITGDQEQYDLFEAAAGAGEPVAVRLDEVRLERARRFGDVWLGWRLWCALGHTGRELVPWPAMAAILVIARLCEPSSELHIAQDWYRSTALADLLGVAAERINDDRLYRTLDWLLPHKRALEGPISRSAWANCSGSTTSFCFTT